MPSGSRPSAAFATWHGGAGWDIRLRSIIAIRARGTGGPRVITEGTIAYLITLDDGFRIMYRDSAGVVNVRMRRIPEPSKV